MNNDSKYIFVTGINGIIGAHISKRLLDIGYKVIGIGRSKECSLIHPSLVYLQADMNDSDKIESILKNYKIYAVIHLAAIVHKKSNDLTYTSYERINYLASKSLFKICSENSVKKILFASTIEVYGNQDADIIDESRECNPGSYYGQTKLAAEKSLLSLAEDGDFNYAIMRFAPVYSKEFTLNIDRRIYLFKNSVAYYFQEGAYSFNFCSVENITDFITAYLSKERLESGIFNISDSGNVSVKRVIELEKTYGALKIAVKLPYNICKVLIGIFERFCRRVLRKETGISIYNFNKLFKSTVYANKKAKGIVEQFKWNIENTRYKRH